METYKEPENLVELIEQISKRPAMFVGSYNYYMAVSFVEGYVYARRRINNQNEAELLKSFSRWLAEKLAKPSNLAWSVIIKDFYKEDDDAFKHLPELFKEFIEVKNF